MSDSTHGKRFYGERSVHQLGAKAGTRIVGVEPRNRGLTLELLEDIRPGGAQTIGARFVIREVGQRKLAASLSQLLGQETTVDDIHRALGERTMQFLAKNYVDEAYVNPKPVAQNATPPDRSETLTRDLRGDSHATAQQLRTPAPKAMTSTTSDRTFAFSQANLERLHRHALPYEEPNKTLTRVLDRLEAGTATQPTGASSADAPDESPNIPMVFAITDPIETRFSKIISAKIDGQVLFRPKWNALMEHLCNHAVETRGLEWLIKLGQPTVTMGQRLEGGYHPLDEANASIQYTNAIAAWQYSAGLLRALQLPCEIRFQWRDKPAAAFPGQVGVIRWEP